MLTIILAILLGSARQNTAGYEDVAVIELNHFRSCAEVPYCTQLIAWEWSGTYRRLNVVSWSFSPEPDRLPRRVGKLWKVTWNTQKHGPVTFVAPIYRETWTQYDPEVANKQLHPETDRRCP